jgi:hypothetical protein
LVGVLNSHDTCSIERRLNCSGLTRNRKYVAIDHLLIPVIILEIVRIHHRFVPGNISDGTSLLMDATKGVAELVDNSSGELGICCLVVEPPEVHGWLILSDILCAGANVRPGPAWSDGHADVSVAGCDEVEGYVGIFGPSISKLLDFGCNERTCTV